MPEKNKQFLFDKGVVNNPDRAMLRPGEMYQASGCEYRLGTGELFMQPGRALTSAALSAEILALYRGRYESAADVLIAADDSGNLYEATPGTTTTFGSAQLTGLTASARPHFSAIGDRVFICNGSDDIYVREPGTITGGASNYRTLAMQQPQGQTTVTVQPTIGAKLRPNTESGDFDNPELAYDTLTATFAYDELTASAGTPATSITIEVYDPNATTPAWTIVYLAAASYNRVETTVALEDGDFTTGDALRVRATLTEIATTTRTVTHTWTYGSNLADTDRTLHIIHEGQVAPGGGLHWIKLRDIRALGSAGITNTPVTYGLQYLVTERYFDSDGVAHESEGTTISDTTGAVDQIYGVIVDLPTKRNSFTSEFVIYRTLDTVDGGFPILYEVGTADPDDTTWTDDFTLSLTLATDKADLLYPTISVTFVEGTGFTVPQNAAPPTSKMALPFDGSVVYIPTNSNTISYSLPTTITIAGAAKVPAIYYLEFLTGRNDTVVSAAVTNGGRQLVVFFNDYSMLVTRIPLALDSTVFDNRIREYISEKRGCAGTFCSTTFTVETSGRSVAASVDSLGLWVTDGNSINNWSDDFDWEGEFANVDHANSTLIDNPQMRRLELLYKKGTSWYELHFFYGRIKETNQPLITGPHPSTVRSRHYANVSGSWLGWSGDSTSTGNIYTERQGSIDASNSYDSAGNVIFTAESGDTYPDGVGRSANLIFTYPKYKATTPNIDFTHTLTAIIDASEEGIIETSRTQTYKGNRQRKELWQMYGDRFRFKTVATSREGMPPIMLIEYTTKNEGVGRNW